MLLQKVRGLLSTKRQQPHVHLSDEEAERVATIQFLVSLKEPRPARQPTDDEIAIAAWANLAIEEQDFTLDEARKILAAT